MKAHIMTFSPSDILVVPFPFVDSPQSKKRPVVVLSNREFNAVNEHYVAAMITTASHSNWLGDTPIKDLNEAGLKHPSFIRLKLFTLDARMVLKKIGTLSEKDKRAFEQACSKHLFPSPH